MGVFCAEKSRTPTKKHEFSFEKKEKIIEKPIDILSLRVYIRRVDKIKEDEMTDKLDLSKLTGSEKQIEWAKSILNGAYNAAVTGYNEIAVRDDLSPKFLQAAEIVCAQIRAKMEENTSASSVIDRRGIITYSVISKVFGKEVQRISETL